MSVSGQKWGDVRHPGWTVSNGTRARCMKVVNARDGGFAARPRVDRPTSASSRVLAGPNVVHLSLRDALHTGLCQKHRRVLGGGIKSSHISPVLKSLHWLIMTERCRIQTPVCYTSSSCNCSDYL